MFFTLVFQITVQTVFKIVCFVRADHFFLKAHFFSFIMFEKARYFITILFMMGCCIFINENNRIFKIHLTYLINSSVVLIDKNLNSRFKFLNGLENANKIKFTHKLFLTFFKNDLRSAQVFLRWSLFSTK